MFFNGEKEIYVAISKRLDSNETIEFDPNLGSYDSVFLLKEGCKAMNLPPMTMIVYVPHLVWESQRRVKELVDEREDVKFVYFIYNHISNSGDLKLKPERFLGKMETISYEMFNATL